MPSNELTLPQAWQEPVADAAAPGLGSPRITVGSQPGAGRSRGRAVFPAIARWLRGALAASARGWALAAGVPPDLYS